MEIADWVSSSIALLALVVVVFQLRAGIRSFKADHERRRKQATIEFITKIRPIWDENQRILDETFGEDTLTAEAIARLEDEPETRHVLRSLLANLEFMAVGMNTGVFDKDLLYRMAASYLIGIYHRLRPYINHVQRTNPYTYIEFEEIVSRFEEKKRLRPDPRGSIRYS
jgi:hypothetical protein